MGLVIGIDEAGYGPNLGPLVVAATVWSVPDNPHQTDLWSVFNDGRDGSSTDGPSKAPIGDSKRMYNSNRSLDSLERPVLAALRLAGLEPSSFQELVACLTPQDAFATNDAFDPQSEPWFQGADLALPRETNRNPLEELATHWTQRAQHEGIRLHQVCSDVVLTERFNHATRKAGSKGRALTRISLGLLSRLWHPDDSQAALIIADKHGGRNRYDGLMAEVWQDRMLFRLQESRRQSRYRMGTAEIRFESRAEAHLPVALASMTAKYLRELAMILFNRFWCTRCPGLKPTKGYPLDAKRFKRDIAAVQQQLEISDGTLWRDR